MGKWKTKGQTLALLKEKANNIKIQDLLLITYKEYCQSKEAVLKKIQSVFACTELIIRSSSLSEDTGNYSNAGKYTSVLNINSADKEELESSIDTVFSSYEDIYEQDEVLVQPMLNSISKSGVVFTADLDTLAPYYIVNYYDGQDSAAVTSGETNKLHTYISYKYTAKDMINNEMEKLFCVLRQLEIFFDDSALDIEFAINDIGDIYIFQVRPIVLRGRKIVDTNVLDFPLLTTYKKVMKLTKTHPFLYGHRTCFGVMPDWNPAEILGIRPKKLAISLYKELVTDNVWAHQRADYGYRDLTLHPLMVSFCGIPYIDTRITFNSFIPQTLNPTIAEKLVNYYIDRLAEYPLYHDKIEFEIVYSCYYFGLSEKLKKLLNYGFNENELKRIEFSLLNLTNNIIHPEHGLYKKDILRINTLKINHEKIMQSEISVVDKIYWLIEECKKYGTLPFAGVARAAFIAVQFLNSFVKEKIITQTECDLFMHSLNTVNKQMCVSINEMQNGKITKNEFVKKYGHIRPGTYDILSARYDEAFDEYFSAKRDNVVIDDYRFSLSDTQMELIENELIQNGLEVNAKELITFIKEAIEGREYLKLIFTKSVSEILRLVQQLGNRIEIDREDMAHIDISVIKQLYVDLYYDNVHDVFMENINHNKEQYEVAKLIKLPSVIINPEDVYSFYLLDEEPNFITQKMICGSVVTEEDIVKADLTGKIVFIKSADPGYDFLFSKGIGGLITQFGGANSHMSIRCAELGIPAIIGAGEQNFLQWQKNDMLKIDCLKKQVIVL